MQTKYYIGDGFEDLEGLWAVFRAGRHLALSEKAIGSIRRGRAFLDEQLKQGDRLFYGINTGFGALCDVRISPEQTQALQERLLLSHACGIGPEAPADVIRLMMLLKVQSLSYGYSGVREELVQRLVLFYNEGVVPVVYQLGSLGASGDLAPLAHLSLPLIGEGEVHFNGKRMGAMEALDALGVEPIVLASKEGLALLNGTQFSLAYAVWCVMEGDRLARLADCCAAMSIDAFDCSTAPYHPSLQAIRPHEGQVRVAAVILDWLAGSDLVEKEKEHVQDPYAFRCVPQVHGASWGAMEHVREVVLTEVNAVTDNPNVFAREGLILSGGNFHAQPLALALDYLAIALSELGSISERRTYQLISGRRGLPDFLTSDPGLNSGMMIPQYTAASMASQNKQLCTPASVDSIVSSNLQEDHVSMAANAGTKAYQVVQNLERILAIEWMTAAQALEFRLPLTTSPRLKALIEAYRRDIPRLEEDRLLSRDMHATITFMRNLGQLAAG
ncbi:MAG: histidine ammonia-lyase [Bacteroidota bacterium]